MKGMTGYGEGKVGGVQAEIKTCNHRFLEIETLAPLEFSFGVEKKIREKIKEKIKRGKVTVKILGEGEEEEVLKAVSQALREVVESREKEGKLHFESMKKSLEKIKEAEKNLEELLPREEENLKKRIRELIGTMVEEEKLEKEVTSLLRREVTEEKVRFSAWVKEFEKVLPEKGEVGKTLSFLLGELKKEINTLGDKSTSLAVIKEVLKIKVELEKLREQVQNIE